MGVKMPEGPEAQVITDELKRTFIGKDIIALREIGGRYTEKKISGNLPYLFPQKVVDVYRAGKAIVIELHEKKIIVINLGMTGKFSKIKEKHSSVEFETENDSIFFVDQRRFGMVRVFDLADKEKALPDLGWDALNNSPIQLLEDRLNEFPDKPIGSVMMDPYVFSGIGNYLRAEILYHCQISPWRKCESLTREDIENIAKFSCQISQKSYSLGGNTIENFQSLSGGTGDFSKELCVYAKRKDPHGEEVIAEKTPDGRTIHWCPSIQK